MTDIKFLLRLLFVLALLATSIMASNMGSPLRADIDLSNSHVQSVSLDRYLVLKGDNLEEQIDNLNAFLIQQLKSKNPSYENFKFATFPFMVIVLNTTPAPLNLVKHSIIDGLFHPAFPIVDAELVQSFKPSTAAIYYASSKGIKSVFSGSLTFQSPLQATGEIKIAFTQAGQNLNIVISKNVTGGPSICKLKGKNLSFYYTRLNGILAVIVDAKKIQDGISC